MSGESDGKDGNLPPRRADKWERYRSSSPWIARRDMAEFVGEEDYEIFEHPEKKNLRMLRWRGHEYVALGDSVYFWERVTELTDRLTDESVDEFCAAFSDDLSEHRDDPDYPNRAIKLFVQRHVFRRK